MAVSSRKSTVQVAFEVDGQGNVTRAFLATEDSAKRAAKGIDEVGAAGKRSSDGLADLNRQAAMAGAVLGGALVAGLTLVARNSIQAQKEQAQLAAVLRSTGEAAGYSIDQLNKMAASMSANSMFSAGDINEAQTRLLSYSGIVGENFPAALQVAIDQAERLGMTVTQSAEVVGRALESPTKAAAALAQQGFGAAFTESVTNSIKALEAAGREAEAQRIIIDILNESYGGAAEAARDTFGGALVALKNTLEDLTTGDDGSLDGATDAVNELIETLNDPAVQDGFSNLVSGAMSAIEWLARLASTTASVANWLGEEVAARVHGAAADDIVRMQQERDRIMEVLSNARTQGGAATAVWDAGREMMGLPTTDQLRTRLGELHTLIDQYNADPPKFTPLEAPATPTGNGPVPEWVDPKERDRQARESKAEAARAARELAKAEREAAEAAADLTRTQDDALAMLEDLRAEMEGPTAQVMLEYMRMEREFDFLFAGGALTAEQYAEAMDLVYQARGRAMADIAQQTKEAADSMTVYADQAARNMQSAFADFLFDPFEDGLSGMLQSFSETLQRMYAEYLASEIFRSFMGGMDSSGNNWGSIIDLFSGGSGFGFAKGGAIQGSDSLSAYSGSVVDKPTAFMFAKGGAVGVMGEVPGEAEGIFPLKRGRDGKLGVAAEISGGGGGTVVEIHNYGNEQARAESSHTDDGRELIQVFIGEAARNVATGGALAGAIEGAYGVHRGGVR